MKAAGLTEIKKALQKLPPEEVLNFCLRLARFKKENKELLTYLIFEAGDEAEYIRLIQQDIDDQFIEINRRNLYYTTKSLRKILRNTNKFIRYSGNKQTEVELLIYYLQKLRDSKIPVHRSTALTNLYQRQLIKIKKTISALHEDLQYDYLRELEELG